VWPTEPARAGWSFNKWQKTRILKRLRPSNRRQNVHVQAAAPVAAAVPAGVADVAVADEAVLEPDAGVVPRVVDRAAERAVKAADAAARAAADVARAKVVTVMAAVAMVEASSSRT
jgi:hypothetical protein